MTVALPRFSPGVRVAGLVAATAATAAIVVVTALAGHTRVGGMTHVPWWALAAVFLVAEAYPVHLHLRREAHSVALTDFAIVLGFFVVSPVELLVAQLVGAGIAVVVVRRQRPIKVAFNLAQFALGTSIGIVVFRALAAEPRHLDPATWAAALAGAGSAALVGVLLVALVIRTVGESGDVRELPFVIGLAAAASVGSGSLGLAALELLRADRRAVGLLALPAVMCLVGLRSYTRQRRRHEHLEFLYRSMRSMQSAPGLSAAAHELLEAARTMASADFAELILLPRAGGEPVLRAAADRDRSTPLGPAELSQPARFALDVASVSEKAMLLPRGRDAHVLDAYLAEHGLSDALVSAIQGDGGLAGMLLVGERLGDVATFSDDDRKLVETLAGHAGVVLENEQVREQLRHQAYHDALTGLPNRVLFTEHVRDSLAAGRLPAVLFVELDDFKTINDSLGHGAGDEVLVAAAARIQRCVGPEAAVARLGGDEFGVLLSTASVDDASSWARRLLESFRTPLVLPARELRVSASIGVAAAGETASTAEELLRNADVAMYTAKTQGKRGYAIYESALHARALRRQELVSALEQAVERDELRVHYQPIVRLDDGGVIALEALVRWQHPVFGLLQPGSFISLAEDAGLTPAIGRVVLRDALNEARRWQDAGLGELAVSVNLSPRQLQEPQFVSQVASMLRASGIASDRLILEITEATAVRDTEATIDRLRQLRDLGVRVALDDFGTGYSSLSHLRELPIDIVKIAKPFVDALGGAAPDETFVKAILQIATALELEVVAEGVEEPEQAEILGALGCRLVQGYLFARPMVADDVDPYVRRLGRAAWRRAGEGRAGLRLVSRR